MTEELCVFLLASAGVVFLPALRRTPPGDSRAPRLSLLAWQLGSVSIVVSWVLSAFVLVGGRAGLLIGGAVLLRLCWSVGSVGWRSRRIRSRHAAAVALVGRRDTELGATLLDSDTPAVYCVAGRPPTIVVTSGARAVLPPAQLAAALAHERTHLADRHHLHLVLADGVARTFPRLPIFAVAQRETAALPELLADDEAARQHGRATVAEALLRLASGRAPKAAMGAGGAGILPRVERLLAPPAPLSTGERVQRTAYVGLVATGPLVSVAVAALVMAWHACTAIAA